MSSSGKKQVLKIVKGHELNIHVSDEICCEYSFMKPAYRQAMHAVVEIVKQTNAFHQDARGETDIQLTNRLFQYNANIIAFVGQWGSGKTRTMLSLSSVLSNSNTQRSCSSQRTGCKGCNNSFLGINDQQQLSGCNFYSMPPIAPSSLEKQQNILYIVLSRLYCYAEELLNPGLTCGRINEKDKAELHQAFHRCLSGINGIKNPEIGALTDLSTLQDISDGLSLRKHFYNLVQKLLQISAPHRDHSKNYLILQLDDADSQIKFGYDVLEDVRKYLVIPNLIILMSADIDFLHKVILQDHLQQFKELLALPGETIGKELTRMSRKYIDKLIPPSHMVHLPEMDKIAEVRGDQLILEYVKDENGTETSLLPWTQNDTWDLQSTLLMLIYRKTGIVFCSPSTYLHNIIPRTMRGLNQLLYVLSEMDDVPKLSERAWTDVHQLATDMQVQLPHIEDNLDRFTRYFTKDWIGAKIRSSRDKEFLTSFYKTASSNRVRLATTYLSERFQLEKDGTPKRIHKNTRIYLEGLMTEIEQTHRNQDDFLLLFTIRTLFTLESHKLVIWQKQKTLNAYFEAVKSGKPQLPKILIFDYDPAITYLPLTYLLNPKVRSIKIGSFNVSKKAVEVAKKYHGATSDEEKRKILEDNKIRYSISPSWVDEILEAEDKSSSACIQTKVKEALLTSVWDIFCGGLPSAQEATALLGRTMVTESDGDEYCINVMNFITVLLRLGNPTFKINEVIEDSDISTQQRLFYVMQEMALLIACNWDVQGRLYKLLDLDVSSAESIIRPDTNSTPVKKLQAFFGQIDNVIKNITNGKLLDYLENTYYSEANYTCPTDVKWSILEAFNNWVMQSSKLKIVPDGSVLDTCITTIFGGSDMPLSPKPQKEEMPPTASPTTPTTVTPDEATDEAQQVSDVVASNGVPQPK